MASYADEIVRVSDGLGIDPGWLANVINFESRGGDPKVGSAAALTLALAWTYRDQIRGAVARSGA